MFHAITFHAITYVYVVHQQKDMSETKLTYIWIKSGELMCQILVCYLNIYYM